MLPLKSQRWKDLDHAYGDATDLPELLHRLASGYDDVLDDVFGAVCHQGSVYSASFAAVPHLLQVALHASDPEWRAQVLILIGSIKASTDYRTATPVPEDIQGWYSASLPAALLSATATLRESLDETTGVYLLQAAAALSGLSTLGRVLSGLADQEFAPVCPACRHELYVWPGVPGLVTATEDPVFNPNTKRTHVTPLLPDSPHSATFAALTRLASGPSLHEVRPLLPHLFGSTTCPACEHSFHLLDAL